MANVCTPSFYSFVTVSTYFDSFCEENKFNIFLSLKKRCLSNNFNHDRHALINEKQLENHHPRARQCSECQYTFPTELFNVDFLKLHCLHMKYNDSLVFESANNF